MVASSTTAIAFFSLKAYKLYKELQKGAISNEELEVELEARRLLRETEKKQQAFDDIDVEELPMGYDGQIAEEVDEFEIDEDGIYIDPEDMREEKEGEELRYAPNSQEALDQFKGMNLAEFDTIRPAKDIMMRLYNQLYVSGSRQDRMVWEYLVDERVQFFGDDCEWNEYPTWADLILHYARLIDFDIDGGVEYWTNVILDNLGLEPNMSDTRLGNTLGMVSRHQFTGPNGFGIFGLNDELYQKVLDKSMLGDPITFFKEYNAFLESKLEEDGWDQIEEVEDYVG